MSARASRTLLIFAKEPNPDSAKARLAPAFDGARRVELYAAMLRDTAQASRDADCDRRVLLWAPEATPRLLVALLETYQNKDGTISIPEPLQPYFGRELID